MSAASVLRKLISRDVSRQVSFTSAGRDLLGRQGQGMSCQFLAAIFSIVF